MSAQLTHALLLTAGLGTRLRPLTTVRAKPAIPVAGVPMACRIIDWLATSGVTDVTLNLHHLPASLATVVGDGTSLGVRARYSWEHPQVLGSAGGPRQALDIVGADRFFIVNGDTITDAALGPLAEAHAASGALVTLAAIPNVHPQYYSGLRLAADGSVAGIEPKGSTRPSFHFIGVQVAEVEAFAMLPKGTAANSISGLYDALMDAKPGSIRAHVCDAQFFDIGTVDDYWQTSWQFAGTAAGSNIGTADVASDATVTSSILWDRVRIGAGARVTRCILTDDVVVTAGSVHTDEILMRGSEGHTLSAPLRTETR